MGTQDNLAFKRVYVRSIISCAAAEMISNKRKVQKPYRPKKLISKLKEGLSADQSFEDFSTAKPIFNFNCSRTDYKDEFWRPYYNLLGFFGPSHFPFEMKMNKTLKRSVDWNQFKSLAPEDLTFQSMELRCRLFPYGALSFHLIEQYEFSKNCTPNDLITLIQQPLTFNGATLKQGLQIQRIRTKILKQLLESEFSITNNCQPQNIVISPSINSEIDVDVCWKGFANLLSASNNPAHISQHTRDSYFNYGRKGQFIYFSPFSTVVITPDLYDRQNGLQCLRERTANIVEMAIIQNEFARIYNDRYSRMISDIKSRKGYPWSQLVAFIRNGKNGLRPELEALRIILNLQDNLAKQRWVRWHSAVAKLKLTDYEQFMQTLEALKDNDASVGHDVRISINSTLDSLKKVKEIIPESMDKLTPSQQNPEGNERTVKKGPDRKR